MGTSSGLERLPAELQRLILDNLDLPSKIALRLGNHHFNALIPRPTHAELLVAERTPWATICHLYACRKCVRLRPSNRFTDAMKKGPRGRNGKVPCKRFCIDCGLDQKKGGPYSRGAEFDVEGRRHVVCWVCRKPGERGSENSSRCKECYDQWKYKYL
jgi:hypothetical protein